MTGSGSIGGAVNVARRMLLPPEVGFRDGYPLPITANRPRIEDEGVPNV